MRLIDWIMDWPRRRAEARYERRRRIIRQQYRGWL